MGRGFSNSSFGRAEPECVGDCLKSDEMEKSPVEACLYTSPKFSWGGGLVPNWYVLSSRMIPLWGLWLHHWGLVGGSGGHLGGSFFPLLVLPTGPYVSIPPCCLFSPWCCLTTSQKQRSHWEVACDLWTMSSIKLAYCATGPCSTTWLSMIMTSQIIRRTYFGHCNQMISLSWSDDTIAWSYDPIFLIVRCHCPDHVIPLSWSYDPIAWAVDTHCLDHMIL